jgi:hypothetical protein
VLLYYSSNNYHPHLSLPPSSYFPKQFLEPLSNICEETQRSRGKNTNFCFHINHITIQLLL